MGTPVGSVGGGEQAKASAKSAVLAGMEVERSGFLRFAADKNVSGFGRDDGSFVMRIGMGRRRKTRTKRRLIYFESPGMIA
jgi:hypothetical protein